MIFKAGVFSILMFGFVFFGFAQSTRDADAPPKPPSPVYKAKKKEKKGFFLFNLFKKKKQSDVDEVADFRKRMKKRLKQKAKEQEMAAKPQYSDPLYFGHKKPPKKRKPGKKKFCKECGLRH